MSETNKIPQLRYLNKIIGRIKVFVFVCRYHAHVAHLFPRDCAREMSKERPGQEKRERKRERESLIGAETQLFRLSRDRNRIRRGSFRPRTGPSRDVIVTRHLSPSSVSSAAGRWFFLFRVKTFCNEGGRGGKRRRSIIDRGGETNNVPGAISQIGSVGAPTVYKRFPSCFSLVILDG